MQILIINEQRKIPLNVRRIRLYAARALKALKLKPQTFLSITFISAKKIKLFNKKYFNKDKPTDVITVGYPKNKKLSYYKNYLGDILISPEAAAVNARAYRNSLFYEIILYIVHGALHLLGWDDLAEKDRLSMQRKEKEILKNVSL